MCIRYIDLFILKILSYVLRMRQWFPLHQCSELRLFSSYYNTNGNCCCFFLTDPFSSPASPPDTSSLPDFHYPPLFFYPHTHTHSQARPSAPPTLSLLPSVRVPLLNLGGTVHLYSVWGSRILSKWIVPAKMCGQ